MHASQNQPRLEIAFDVGHSSIGWSVLGTNSDTRAPAVLGCGTVIFEKDSALANSRRLHRQQRRHVRATRQRIARMEKLLAHIGAFSGEALKAKHQAAGGHAAPWLLAARVLASDGKRTLTWPQLWDVLRWYAHNRGYEALGAEAEGDAEDTEKVENAKAALAQFGKTTMAETICAWLGLDPLGDRQASTENYKGKNCAFERAIVVAEVVRLLAAHRGKLPGLDEATIAGLTLDARAVSVPDIQLPRRYAGSLLFGRLMPRFHNRIIGECPISGKKIPSKDCPEFLRYRWAMQLANIRVAPEAAKELRPLSAKERATVHARMVADGYLTPGELKRIVEALPGIARHNLEQLLLHPDAEKALTFDPVQRLIASNEALATVWPHLPERLQKRARGRWRRGRRTTLAELRAEAAALGHDLHGFDAALSALTNPTPAKPKRKTLPPTLPELLAKPLEVKREAARLGGRAPYARPLLQKAFEEVMAGGDPKAKGGSLEETEAVRQRREARALDHQTNNHLVRHRLRILGRLLADLLADPAYGAGHPERVARVTLEVNRDLREMAGLTAQEIAKELGGRLASHKKVAARLEKELPAGTPITASLIRKARIADDLNWRCPYTEQEFEPIDLVTKRVDLDHVIPRSQRASDSLDSLVVTFSAINKLKGKRTAWQFVHDEQSKPVPEMPNLSIMTLSRYEAFVAKLDTRGHDDDMKRKRRRKEFLLLPRYEEKGGGFTPGHLTQTSQLARLAAQVVRDPFAQLPQTPEIVPLPGSVTGVVRRSWDLLGTLAAAAPGVLESDGSVKTKTEIREITHLHHALDACVIALAAHFIPNRGDIWRLLTERRLTAPQQAQLAALGLFDFDAQGHFRLRDLASPIKEQIRQRLAERRVVQHVPADMSGIRVEENTRGVLRRENGRVFLRQQKRNAEGRLVVNETDEPEAKVIGLPKGNDQGGKLARIKGVRVIADNYGVAILDDATLPPAERFVIIPHASVWQQLQELKRRNGGKKPQVWRNGQIVELPKGKRSGCWKIYSVMNTAEGLVIKLGRLDSLEWEWKLALQSLLRDGARVLPLSLTGIVKV